MMQEIMRIWLGDQKPRSHIDSSEFKNSAERELYELVSHMHFVREELREYRISFMEMPTGPDRDRLAEAITFHKTIMSRLERDIEKHLEKMRGI